MGDVLFVDPLGLPVNSSAQSVEGAELKVRGLILFLWRFGYGVNREEAVFYL